MKKPDYRTVEDILKHPRWDPLAGVLDMDRVTAPQMRILDDFLAFVEGQALASIWDLTVADFLSFDERYKSANRLRSLKKALKTVLPGQPALIVLTDAIRQKEAAARPPKPGPARPRRLKVSIPEEELPDSWKEALADMVAGIDRPGLMAPSPKMVPTYRMKLRQLACSARKAGLPEAFTAEAVKAYAADMRKRKLAAATQLAAFSALATCGRYMDAGRPVLDLLADLKRRSEAASRKEPKQKYAKLQKTGYSPVGIITRADELLREVPDLKCPRSQQAQRNCAAALALFSVLPVRLADTRIRFGENLVWRNGAYELRLKLSKSGELYDAEVDPRLNRFIDALILRGCDRAWLDAMRQDCMASRRPLFVRNDGESVGYNYVSDCWRKVFGTGEHISRTILHTFLGVELGAAGTDLSLSACGQSSPDTAATYQDDIVKKAGRIKGQAALAEVAQDADATLFAFR
ncbi:MAG: hypothetical protein GJ678_13120 [Rhodobacteraceae bacterium]|nr:hypothetical protein [Paracoccaceae bacterium]